MQKYLMEVLGTFFLVLAFGLTNDAFAVGITLSVLIYLGRSVSGAHYNPAVSFAFFLKRKQSGKEFIAYFGSQLLGAFLASVVILWFSKMVFYLEPPDDTNLYQQAGAEVLFTFLFVLVMMFFSLKPILRKNHLYGFAAGLTFGGIIIIGSRISGGAFNPAISVSSALLDLFKGGNSYIYTLLYLLGPLTGGALAAFVFSYFQDQTTGS